MKVGFAGYDIVLLLKIPAGLLQLMGLPIQLYVAITSGKIKYTNMVHVFF